MEKVEIRRYGLRAWWKVTVLLLSLCVPGAAFAQNRDKALGLGIIILGPTGFSVNYRLSAENSVDAALAWDIDKAVYIHGDYLFKTKTLHQEGTAVLTAHYGLGARIAIIHDDHYDRGRSRWVNRDRFGLRAPLGVDIWFPKPSLEVFLELAAIMDIVESTDLSLDIGLGLRYYF